ncbi:zinc ribbon domain-containing protein [Ktedonospora formicarum]|uniref:DZANK-type domain-containing protein n=1 Tax=Ktedonospora formicarum TaxID=2778364 RepID=A0A8J3MRH4_9CHLR|nr:zinc ribbon domain-containing protein [Ktedonospora formicarum]GHO43633.1 hypothetical protein KSX_17960 [Ktedonospora formicarum]
MSQNYVVPNIYQDLSNQSQGYFAFRFTCQSCYWQVDTRPVRSSVSTASNVMDIGIEMLNGFWGRAAEAGQKIYGTQWHTEQAEALQRSWAEIQHNFHTCPRCYQTVCMRCFNVRLNLCTRCAPDLKADGAQFQHELNIDAQRKQIESQYQAPQFNVNIIPTAATPDLVASPPTHGHLASPQMSNLPPGASPYQPVQASGQVHGVPCPTCRRMGVPGKFCQDCGTKLPAREVICPHCTQAIEPGTRFCPECGAKLQAAT